VNSEPKPFASLSSGLLARKGAARPAMRPQGFGQLGASLEDLGWNDMGFEPPRPALAPVRDADHDAFGEVLAEAPIRSPFAGLTPASSPVHDQQAEIAGRLGASDREIENDEPGEEIAGPVETASVVSIGLAQRKLQAQRSAPGSKAKAAFTLRLDSDRHLKLRLACAVTGRSAQMLVTNALDGLLASMPGLDALAAQAPASSRKG
jgi:hypothetical protein